jgi:Cu(I)/Ag(I) efflux system membrane fusion protein
MMLNLSHLRRILYLLVATTVLVAGALAIRERLGGDVVETAVAASGWTCSKHPDVRQTTPGKCPRCQMSLVTARPERQLENENTGAIVLDSRRRQLIGVRTARATHASLSPRIRVSGIVRYDESRVTDFNLKLQGWVRDVHVSYVGQRVQRGQPLFRAYSPDLDALLYSLIGALRARESAPVAQAADGPQYNDRLVESPRLRLKQWDVADEELQTLEKTRQLPDAVVFRSPKNGVVIAKSIVEGMHFEPGQTLYRIADASVLIVEADFHESEVEMVRVGGPVVITLDALPGRTFSGRVVSVYPFLNEETRTLKARIELLNRDGRLKPGMFATVEAALTPRHGLVVPTDAVVDSGSRQVVFVAQGGGYFEPRTVTTGDKSDGLVLVLGGLRDGEEVATRATFFLDSESQMRSALQDYQGVGSSSGPSAAAAGLRFTIGVTPDPPRTGENVLEVRLTDVAGHPVSDADIDLVLSMPAMPLMNMPAMRSEARLTHLKEGRYTGRASISMGGRWDVTITARREGRLLGSTHTTLLVR